MIRNVTLTGYRGFQHYKMANLGRVNLLVGKNNCGKTALLEGIHLLAAGGDPSVLYQTTLRRGEYVSAAEDEPPFNDFSHFFFQHEIRPGSNFSIKSDNGFPDIQVTATPSEDIEGQEELFDIEDMLRPALALSIERRGASQSYSPIFVSDRGAGLAYGRRPGRRLPVSKKNSSPPIIFISPDSLRPQSLASMWSQILRDRLESEVLDALRILESDIEDIVFEPAEKIRYLPGIMGSFERGGVLISLRNEEHRIPLGSMGDGMRRLLVLAISLIQAKNGFLLVDEIDTGFHFSVMHRMWELVLKIACKSNIQVFATTHSWDCIAGLSEACKSEDTLQDQVTIQTIDRNLSESVTFTGDSIIRMVKHDIDPR